MSRLLSIMYVALCVCLGACAGGDNSKFTDSAGAKSRRVVKAYAYTPQPADPAVENYLKEAFADMPYMVEVCRCESRMRQWGPDGQPLRGDVHPPDIGVCQINTSAHGKKLRQLGLDANTLEGNIAFTKYLARTEGTTPWNSSRSCWGRKVRPKVARQ